MKSSKYLYSMISIVVLFACLYVSAAGQGMDDKNKLAALSGAGSSVRWDISAPNAGATLIISAPDGRVFSKEFKGGSSPQFSVADIQGERLPDGYYTYELRLMPTSSPRKDATSNGRGKSDEAESVRAARKPAMPAPLVESGSFSIVNGAVIVAGTSEETSPRRTSKVSGQTFPGAAPTVQSNLRLHHVSPFLMPDQVIPDDLIVQGSACVGLDCVNNETFGFDTIRLKENNDRLQFDDTSSSAGFPTNNWQIRANSSASGGASFLGFVDQGAAGNSETGTIVFEVDAGAPANSLKVSSTGRVGLRTGTPALDLQITTSDTPAHRLEQTNAGGFTAQTWDIAGNEANFFVRDVTGGSRLPFRIRPGAPTSSVDISATGNVGIGTASPTLAKLVVFGGNDAASANAIHVSSVDGTTSEFGFISANAASDFLRFGYFDGTTTKNVFIDTGNSGRVGIGTSAPDQKLSVNGDASKAGGGSWQTFSDERLKNVKGTYSNGLKAVMQLQPIRYEYKHDNALGINSAGEHVGFGAQAVQKIIPEAVSSNANGYLMVNNDPIMWTMLNAIKEQQKQIEQLKTEVRQLRKAARRHR
jgi:hypothetical protein